MKKLGFAFAVAEKSGGKSAGADRGFQKGGGTKILNVVSNATRLEG